MINEIGLLQPVVIYLTLVGPHDDFARWAHLQYRVFPPWDSTVTSLIFTGRVVTGFSLILQCLPKYPLLS